MKLHNGSVARMFSPIMRTPALCKESHGRVATSLGQTTSAVAEHATEAYGLKPTRRTKPNQTKPQANKQTNQKTPTNQKAQSGSCRGNPLELLDRDLIVVEHTLDKNALKQSGKLVFSASHSLRAVQAQKRSYNCTIMPKAHE